MVALFLVETFYIGYQKVFAVGDLLFNNQEIYEYLASDKDIFRVYCTTYCFNPQLVSKYKLQVLHGETPIQDVSFVNFLQSAGGYSYNNFAVIFPPYPVWQTENPPIPSAQNLGLANVKYIATIYRLEEKNFTYLNKFDNLFLYRNEQFKPRVYFKDNGKSIEIEKYSPNRITFKSVRSETPQILILSEKFYPGWQVLMNNRKLKIDKELPIFRKILIPPNTQWMEIVYNPDSFKLGMLITTSTILFSILYFILIRKESQ